MVDPLERGYALEMATKLERFRKTRRCSYKLEAEYYDFGPNQPRPRYFAGTKSGLKKARKAAKVVVKSGDNVSTFVEKSCSGGGKKATGNAISGDDKETDDGAGQVIPIQEGLECGSRGIDLGRDVNHHED